MAAVTDVEFDPDRFSNTSLGKLNWIDVKVQKAALYTLSSIALVGAAVGCAAASFTPIPVGFALTSFFLALYSRSLIDYNDPATLSRIRNEALTMSLSQIVKVYGWKNLFVYSLLDQAAFQAAYSAHVDALSFERILSFYREVSGKLALARRSGPVEDFSIPLPSEWKDRFFLETEKMRIDLIVERVPLNELKSFDILSIDEMSLFEEVKSEIAFFNDRNTELQRQFTDRTYTENAALQRAVETAEYFYAQHPAHTLLRQMRSYFCCHCGAFNYQFYSMICELERSLFDAREARDKAIACAQEQYCLAVLPVKGEIDALLLSSKERYEERILRLDQQFRAVRLASL